MNFNFRVFQRAFVLARRHRPNSGFPCAVRMELAVCSWNSKGSSQLLDLPFQFLIQRSTFARGFTPRICSRTFHRPSPRKQGKNADLEGGLSWCWLSGQIWSPGAAACISRAHIAGKMRSKGYAKVHHSHGEIDSRRAGTRQIATWWEATRAPQKKIFYF